MGLYLRAQALDRGTRLNSPTAIRRTAFALGTVFVLAMVAARWSPRTGFTSLLCFGGPKWEERLPELRRLPVARDTGTGYDGQFGAQLAVTADPSSAETRAALDNPAYRARRILLAWSAHVLGGGQPWRVLQVYALQNLALWLILAWLVAAEVRAAPEREAAAIWLCCLLTLGVLDCVRLSLTDLAGVLLVTAAVRAERCGRAWAAAAALAVAGLARETSLLSLPLLAPAGPAAGRPGWKTAGRFLLAVAPLALWVTWLARTLPPGGALGNGNFDWPGTALARHLALCLSHLGRGDLDSRYVGGFLGALGLAAQSLCLLIRLRWQEPWLRAAAGFAVLFWFLGDNVWHGYWAAARAVLPMTFAFNLLLPRRRGFWAWLLLTNAPLVAHGIWRMLP